MLIYPRPSKDCRNCEKEKVCSCKCHDIDLINCRHHIVRVEGLEITVKPVVDLEHFRD